MEVVSNNHVTKMHNALFTCALEALSRFSSLATSPCFCDFSVILGGGGKLLLYHKSPHVAVIVCVKIITGVSATYHLPVNTNSKKD